MVDEPENDEPRDESDAPDDPSLTNALSFLESFDTQRTALKRFLAHGPCIAEPPDPWPWHRFEVEAAAELSDARPLPSLNLESYRFRAVRKLDEADARALASSARLGELRVLILASNHLADGGGRALAQSHHASNLLLLDLGDNNLREAGVRALAASPHLRSLVCLNLGRAREGSTGSETPRGPLLPHHR